MTPEDVYMGTNYVQIGISKDKTSLTHVSPKCHRIYASVTRVNIGSDNGLTPIRAKPLSKPKLGIVN